MDTIWYHILKMKSVIGNNDRFYLLLKCALVVLLTPHSNATTIRKIFETNSSFHMKQCTARKAQFLFFSSFLPVLTKFSFWEED